MLRIRAAIIRVLRSPQTTEPTEPEDPHDDKVPKVPNESSPQDRDTCSSGVYDPDKSELSAKEEASTSGNESPQNMDLDNFPTTIENGDGNEESLSDRLGPRRERSPIPELVIEPPPNQIPIRVNEPVENRTVPSNKRVPIIRVQNMWKTYRLPGSSDTVSPLKGVTLNFHRGELTGIIGPSGTGKTTLLNMVGGIDVPDSGELYYSADGTQLAPVRYKDKSVMNDWRKLIVSTVFQDHNLIGSLNAAMNIGFPLTFLGLSWWSCRKKARKILEEMDLEDKIHSKPNELSGGQNQRLAVARALIKHSKIILADEPTGSLDTDTSLNVMKMMKRIQADHGKTIILVTHNENIAQQFCDRIYAFKRTGVVNKIKG